MLVLNRKLGEKIIIDTKQGQVIVDVRYIGNGRVKLSIDAPDEMKIMRAELLDNEKS
jgi:carbon storage regulator CsrA